MLRICLSRNSLRRNRLKPPNHKPISLQPKKNLNRLHQSGKFPRNRSL